MKAIIAWTGGRAPPSQNTRSPCAGRTPSAPHGHGPQANTGEYAWSWLHPSRIRSLRKTRCGSGPGPQRRPATLFRRPEPGPLQREAKEPPGAVLRCAAALTGHPMRQVAWGPLGAGPPRLRLSAATRAAAVAPSRPQEPPMLDGLLSPPVPADTDDGAGQASSPAVHPLDDLA